MRQRLFSALFLYQMSLIEILKDACHLNEFFHAGI